MSHCWKHQPKIPDAHKHSEFPWCMTVSMLHTCFSDGEPRPAERNEDAGETGTGERKSQVDDVLVLIAPVSVGSFDAVY